MSYGRADSVRRVVLVPGFMQSAAAWGPVAERLPPRFVPKPLDFEADGFESRLTEIRAAAGANRAVLAGYSMGGRLALHAAWREPGRYGGLVMLGASPGVEPEAARVERRARDEALAAWIEGAEIERVVEHWESIPVLADQPPELVAAQRPDRLRQRPLRLAAALRSCGQGALPSLWPRLDALRDLPVLLLAGERDRPYAEVARRVADTLPRAEATVVPGAGHAAHLERPEAVADQLLEFLGGLESRPGGSTA